MHKTDNLNTIVLLLFLVKDLSASITMQINVQRYLTQNQNTEHPPLSHSPPNCNSLQAKMLFIYAKESVGGQTA